MRVYFFGCWNASGHCLHAPGGLWVPGVERGVGVIGQDRISLDGNLAPKRWKRAYGVPREQVGAICWQAAATGNDADERKRARERVCYDAEECPQGQFVRHVLDNGFTALAWWDRCQGDDRGACNSVFLLEGEHDTPTMLAALREHFPHVVANLERHGVKLVEVST